MPIVDAFSARNLRIGRFAALVAGTLAALGGQAAIAQSGDGGAPPPSVTVSVAEKRPLENRASFSGRVEAVQSADLMARVVGYLAARSFDEGSMVESGELLFELDSEVYRNALNQAEAALRVAQANEVLAQQQFSRQSDLTARNVQSRAALEEAQANLDISSAGIAQARAQVESAQINLDYTRITAPFAGKIGRAAVSTGDLIGPSSGPMATIVQVDPIYVSFPVPQSTFLEVQRQGASGDDVMVELVLADGTHYAQQGTIAFADVSATVSTDSVVVRAEVPNPDGVLINQGLVNVSVVAKQKADVLTVPVRALLVDQQGTYVLTVDDQDTVQQARIEGGRQQGGYVEILSGLDEGARVIVDGITKVAPGVKVSVAVAGDGALGTSNGGAAGAAQDGNADTAASGN